MSATPCVHVIDDDQAVRQSLRLLLESSSMQVMDYDRAEAFLAACAEPLRGCIICDIHMPGLNGLELQTELESRAIRLPLIMLTGFGDVPSAVRSLKSGAIDFIEKPFDPTRLLSQVTLALDLDSKWHESQHQEQLREALLATLTPREREVLREVANGHSNKVVAANLEISERTVELHRGRGMRKLKVRTVADLVRLGNL
jgi:two-component system response regulator FixJ